MQVDIVKIDIEWDSQSNRSLKNFGLHSLTGRGVRDPQAQTCDVNQTTCDGGARQNGMV